MEIFLGVQYERFCNVASKQLAFLKLFELLFRWREQTQLRDPPATARILSRGFVVKEIFVLLQNNY